jgi:iron complex outermembrane receptor protein
VLTNGTLAIQTFTNGVDTRTLGLELAVRYPVDLPFGKLDLSMGANYNENKVTSNRLGTLFGIQAQQTLEEASPKFKLNFGALFKSGRFTMNTRVNYYSSTTSLVQPNSASTTAKPIAGTFYLAEIKPTAIVDLELGYDVTDFLNIAIGANNLFNKIPEIPPLVADYNAATWPTTGRSPYINGSGTINAPYTFGPYGSNGGYYYARISAKF